jgi:hypothetical protein
MTLVAVVSSQMLTATKSDGTHAMDSYLLKGLHPTGHKRCFWIYGPCVLHCSMENSEVAHESLHRWQYEF